MNIGDVYKSIEDRDISSLIQRHRRAGKDGKVSECPNGYTRPVGMLVTWRVPMKVQKRHRYHHHRQHGLNEERFCFMQLSIAPLCLIYQLQLYDT